MLSRIATRVKILGDVGLPGLGKGSWQSSEGLANAFPLNSQKYRKPLAKSEGFSTLTSLTVLHLPFPTVKSACWRQMRTNIWILVWILKYMNSDICICNTRPELISHDFVYEALKSSTIHTRVNQLKHLSGYQSPAQNHKVGTNLLFLSPKYHEPHLRVCCFAVRRAIACLCLSSELSIHIQESVWLALNMLSLP